MPKLDGRTALVTGGNSGIGLAAARALAKEGAQVYITGRRQRELATAVEETGSNAVGVLGDVSNLGDLDRLFEQIRREKGRLDILCECWDRKVRRARRNPEELYDSIFDTNVRVYCPLYKRRSRLCRTAPRSFSTLRW